MNDYDKFTKIFHFFEQQGFHITRADYYSPIPVVKDLSDDIFSVKENISIDWNEDLQIHLLNELKGYSSEFRNLIDEKLFDMQNGAFATHDAPVYYSMIRHFKPSTIIEVGAGYSTILSSLAAAKNTNTTITAIDPYVSASLKSKIPDSVKLIEKRVQDIPISSFSNLSKNDILFIDSSHVCRVGSDVNFLYLEVLPLLNSGVLIHIHDIFLPRQYPKDWIKNDHRRFWNEQYLLNAFLIGNTEFEILLANSYLGLKRPELLKRLFETGLSAGGGSFWIRKK